MRGGSLLILIKMIGVFSRCLNKGEDSKSLSNPIKLNIETQPCSNLSYKDSGRSKITFWNNGWRRKGLKLSSVKLLIQNRHSI